MKYLNQNPLEKLHPGEPYFFIRAQDGLAYVAVMNYSCQLKAAGDVVGSREVRAIADAIEDWQKANPDKVKLPD